MAAAHPIPGLDPEESVLSNAVLIVPVRVSELLAYERYVFDPAYVTELHQMRIAAKRLRYSLEILAPAYDGELEEAIDRVKKLQEQLGSIHDADVLVPELEDHLYRTLKRHRKSGLVPSVAGSHFDAAAGLLALCRRKRDERAEKYARFIALWRRLREEAFFERLRATIQRAAADESQRVADALLAANASPSGRQLSRPRGGN